MQVFASDTDGRYGPEFGRSKRATRALHRVAFSRRCPRGLGSALLGIECRSTRKGSARCSIPARHLKFALMMEGQLDFQPIARAMGQFADDEASA